MGQGIQSAGAERDREQLLVPDKSASAILIDQNWRARLSEFIAESRALSFVWGACDCSLWVADALERVTGTDFAADLRGRYVSPRGAAAILKACGYDSVQQLCADRFHPIARPRFGDVVLLPSPPLDALFIAHDTRTMWGLDTAGLVHVAIPAGVQFWSAR